MNLIILFKKDFIQDTNRVCIHDHRLEHIRNVNGASVDDELRVGLLGGAIGTGRITLINKERLEMDVILNHKPPDPLPVTLLLAMPRPRVFKRILTHVSAMGVKKIILINSYRVEKSFWKSPALEEISLERYLILGLEQGQDTLLPDVVTRPLFKPFVEDELPGIVKGTLPFVAHPYISVPCPHTPGKPVTIAVGPEGGFIQYEIDKLIECGFTAVNLGERTLHVESAVTGLISKLT